MSERQPTRAELLARIQASSKDEVVLAEMQRLGFWPADTGQPGLEAALIAREAELVKTLHGLHQKMGERGDPVAALKALRKQRMADALARREATAQAREKRRHERALRWHEARQQEMGYLGAGVSAGLQRPQGKAIDPARLARHGLPLLETPLALAEAMGVSLAELKFLCFHREVARTSHYRRFALPKKTGGERLISAPMPRLKRAQYWVLDQVLSKVALHPAAHGFVPGRSIVTNAAPHCQQAVVINLDLKDFFPSIAYPRIKGVFIGLGYGEDLATPLTLLCSENVSDELAIDGERFFVGGLPRERVLPQGAPTSPMLTNILCRQLDRRLQGVARKLGFAYTRYADDLTFSAPTAAAAACGRLLRQVHFILEDEGFTPHPAKQHVMRSGSRHEVTGIVVNGAAPSTRRAQRRQLRAALHRARTLGVEEATWQGRPASPSQLLGYAQFVHMVNARQGEALLAQARALPGARSAAVPSSASPNSFRHAAARGEAPSRAKGAWWEPAPRPVPQLELTSGQRAAARKARLAEQRALRRAASNPATPGDTGPDAAFTPGSAAASADASAFPLARLGVQMLAMMLLSFGMDSLTMLVLGSCWMLYSLHKRMFAWPLYLMAMLAIFFIAQIT